MDATTTPSGGLRIVTFNVRPDAYRMTAAWAERHGHTIALLVTTPGPPARRSMMYRDTIALAPPTQEIVVTTRPRRLVPIIDAVAPDLIVCGSFPYRIPAEIVDIPRLGAVNLHPAPLPRYRGPNPMRQIYDGQETIVATLHRIEPEFDAGSILSQQTRPIPADATMQALRAVIEDVIMATYEEGLERAIAGDPGTPQDEAQATDSPAYTEAECWLDWRDSPSLLQRRVAALHLEGQSARAELNGQARIIEQLTPLSGTFDHGEAGAILDQGTRIFTVRAGDGAVRVVVAEP